MKAVVFYKPGDVRFETVRDPEIRHPRDVILRVTAAAIGGPDLQVYRGLLPQISKFTMGHEFTGVVEEVGSEVRNLRRGDRVVVPFVVACGRCWFCARGLVTQCEISNPAHYGPEGGGLAQKGGGLFAHTSLYGGYDGGQAEYVRVPFGDFNAVKRPELSAEEISDDWALLLACSLPGACAAIERAGIRGGETVAVFGCGGVGLLAQQIAWLQGAKRVIALDVHAERLEIARRFGAETILVGEGDPVDLIRDWTDGFGVDACVDAVGAESREAERVRESLRPPNHPLSMVMRAVRRGGVVSIIGSYLNELNRFPMAQIFDKEIQIRAGLAPVHQYLDRLMGWVQNRKLKIEGLFTHRRPLAEAAESYQLFSERKDGCLKMVLVP